MAHWLMKKLPSPDWAPFRLTAAGERPDPPRAITTPEGVGDRLRAAAFAEIQAREAFLDAARRFKDAPEDLRSAWIGLAAAEQRHLTWLLDRMRELGHDPVERTVSDQLWVSFRSCRSAEEFSIYMASAEERGRRAGDRFREALREKDPLTGEIFGRIADEEAEHIALADRYFPDASRRSRAKT